MKLCRIYFELRDRLVSTCTRNEKVGGGVQPLKSAPVRRVPEEPGPSQGQRAHENHGGPGGGGGRTPETLGLKIWCQRNHQPSDEKKYRRSRAPEPEGARTAKQPAEKEAAGGRAGSSGALDGAGEALSSRGSRGGGASTARAPSAARARGPGPALKCSPHARCVFRRFGAHSVGFCARRSFEGRSFKRG